MHGMSSVVREETARSGSAMESLQLTMERTYPTEMHSVIPQKISAQLVGDPVAGGRMNLE